MTHGPSFVAALLLAAAAVTHAHDEGGCAAFSWDVSHELALMRGPALTVDETASAPGPLHIGRHYSVHLAPQSGVQLLVPPEHAARGGSPRAAVLRFDVAQPGRYRVSITTRHWIDVIDHGRVVESAAHQGSTGCALLHKVVEFELPAGDDLALQLSGQDDAVVDLVITGPVTAATPSTG